MCRGDISSLKCATCTARACIDSRKLCCHKTSAILWYDHCLYKYANQDFFSQINSQNKFSLVSGAVVGNPASFDQKTRDFLTFFAQNKSSCSPTYSATGLPRHVNKTTEQFDFAQCKRRSPRNFATGVSGCINGTTKLYGLAQYTSDLTSETTTSASSGLSARS
ncbi:hypothetical protein Droror1_Dr00017383 [Drosera rotundifolia]